MVKSIGFTCVCDITGDVMPGSFPTQKDAMINAINAGWVVFQNGIMMSPSVAVNIPDAMKQGKVLSVAPVKTV